MSEYTHVATDIKSLIGDSIHSGFLHHEQEQELLEAASTEDDDPLICYFCNSEITQNQPINLHHPTYKSNGGIQVEPAHESCHVEFHSRQGDFRQWGKLSSLTRRWAFNLKHVKDNPAFDFDRAYYLMLYGH